MLLLCLLAAPLRLANAASLPAAAIAAESFPVKVMVINLFGLEAAPWLTALRPEREFRVPGLSSDFPVVRCNSDAVCQLTTGMGHANAAARRWRFSTAFV
jgi:purine nucleoside permease